MIISYRHRFIFVHCRKTAGSSISCSLSRVLGPWDIQLSAIQETLQLGYRVPVRTYFNALWFSQGKLPLKIIKGRNEFYESVAKNAKKAYYKKISSKPQHASATLIKKAFPNEWGRFFKFCVVRNPYELAVSDYYWRTRKMSAPPTFEYYLSALVSGDDLNGVVPIGFYNNWNQYTIDNDIAVDYIIRYEQLYEGLSKCMRSINVPFDGSLPKAKVSTRNNSRGKSYRDMYSGTTKRIVEKLYSKEIAEFGYRF